ncbi:MAG: DUF2971 domain-containing protein [Candidatus Hydrogenedentes bacterium]|nr:DUF2971 domain-containing protein [Candidatus Hydrogenedentota bacterium]
MSKEMFFSSPAQLNDPFDCRIPLNFYGGTDEEIKSEWLANASERYPHLQGRALTKRINKDITRYSKIRDNPSKRDKTEEYIARDLLKGFGLFSMSANRQCILLWSHYADAHKGYCVGFNTNMLKRDFISVRPTNNPKSVCALFPVSYTHSYPQLSCFGTKEEKIRNLNRALTTKSNVWQYEEEYRLIIMNESNIAITFNEDAVNSVILGALMEESGRKLLLGSLRKWRKIPNVFQAVKSRRAFGLDFCSITI